MGKKGVHPTMKLVAFIISILVNKSFNIAYSPGYVWDFRQHNGGMYN